MASTYTPIATYTAPSNQASVTFSSFAGYTDIEIVVSMKASSSVSNPTMYFNADTGSNYSWTWLGGNGSTAASGRGSNTSSILFGAVGTSSFSATKVNLQNYANTTTYKTAICRGSVADTTSGQTVSAWAGLWRNTGAITSVTFTAGGGGDIATGSTFTLYGIKAA